MVKQSLSCISYGGYVYIVTGYICVCTCMWACLHADRVGKVHKRRVGLATPCHAQSVVHA